MIGDCQCLIDGQHITNEKLIDSLMANMRNDILQSYLKKYTIEQLMEEDHSWKDIQPFMLRQYSFQNSQFESPLSYAVCDGFSIHESQLKKVKIQNAKSIVLASDGYPELENTLEATEEKLQLFLKNDPLCFSIYRSVKGLKKGNISFDDRTYVKVNLERQI
ncbi:hypothetical protein [Metabacillus sp. RGM 3146]|uniref:hypothetical protein n=1 Tax=Metabacillus sp. RGM 3146 TaxID=3401092 RepID=UPI003B9C5BD2